MKIANYIGQPLEIALESLTESAAEKINNITQISLNKVHWCISIPNRI